MAKSGRQFYPSCVACKIWLLCEVASPIQAKYLQNNAPYAHLWEENIHIQNSLPVASTSMRLVVFTNMIPPEFKNLVHTNADKDTKYEAMKERVQALANNKSQRLWAQRH